MKMRPKHLFINIGGFLGPSYSVELCDSGVVYKTNKTGTKLITPKEKQWKDFRVALDSIGVWVWKKDYPNPGVMDGTYWSLKIAYEDTKVSSHGDNNYPRADGTPCNSPDFTDKFNELLKVVQALIGGLEFS